MRVCVYEGSRYKEFPNRFSILLLLLLRHRNSIDEFVASANNTCQSHCSRCYLFIYLFICLVQVQVHLCCALSLRICHSTQHLISAKIRVRILITIHFFSVLPFSYSVCLFRINTLRMDFLLFPANGEKNSIKSEIYPHLIKNNSTRTAHILLYNYNSICWWGSEFFASIAIRCLPAREIVAAACPTYFVSSHQHIAPNRHTSNKEQRSS